MVLVDALGGGQVGVVATGPLGGAVEADGGDVAEHGRRKQQLAGTNVVGLAELGAGNHLLDAKLELTAQGHGGGHCNHGAGLGAERAAHGELDSQDGVAVAVADAVAAAIEGANIVVGGHGADKPGSTGSGPWGRGAGLGRELAQRPIDDLLLVLLRMLLLVLLGMLRCCRCLFSRVSGVLIWVRWRSSKLWLLRLRLAQLMGFGLFRRIGGVKAGKRRRGLGVLLRVVRRLVSLTGVRSHGEVGILRRLLLLLGRTGWRRRVVRGGRLLRRRGILLAGAGR